MLLFIIVGCYLCLQKTQIKNKLEYHGYHPSDDDIKVVKLISSAGDEALSVDLEDKCVYFKVFTPSTQDLDGKNMYTTS